MIGTEPFFHSEIIIQSNLCKTATLKKTTKLVFKTNYSLMQVKSIAECAIWSVLQYFRPSLSYHLSVRSLFCLFLSDRFTQVLKKNLSGIPSECQTVWCQIRPNILSGLIWVQTVCKNYQQMTLVGKELILVMLNIIVYYTPPPTFILSSYKYVSTGRVENSADPDQMAS